MNIQELIPGRICKVMLATLLSAVSYAQPPQAAQQKKELALHGHKRVDNYYWLREGRNPKVKAYLEAENTYLKNTLAPTQDLQNKLFGEISSRIRENDKSVSYKDNGYTYYTRYEASNEYPLYLRKSLAADAKEEVLLDANAMAKGRRYFSLSNFGMKVSPDNKWLALGLDNTGEGTFTILFRNLETGAWLPERIKGTVGDIAWANDSKTIFYSCYDRSYRASKVKKHVIGQGEKDPLMFEEKDRQFDVYVYKSTSGKFVMLRSFSGTSTEYRVLDADKPSSEFSAIQPRTPGLEYSVAHAGGKFYILTNDAAPDFRVMVCPDSLSTKEHWKEVVPVNRNGRIFELEVFRDYLVLQEVVNGIEQIRVVNLKDGSAHYIAFSEEAYSVYFPGAPVSWNYDVNSEWVRFNYSSLVTPDAVYDYNMRTHETKLVRQQAIPDGYQSSGYETKRIYAVAKDGSRIPVTLVYKKGLVLNGENPLLLSAYGAYGGYDTPRFSAARISLLNRGFVYAIAHVRGGEEMGRKWYEDGKQLHKINSFTDFISCAEYLIENKYTNATKLFAQGQSAGGLIMGYAANNYAVLFRGIIMEVPFLDVITTMLGDSYDFPEWGNPKIKAHYDYMLSYSPYDNIKKQAYPAMLVIVGFNDQYWDGAKWVAKVRAHDTGNNPVLLSTDFSSGHDGPSGKFAFYKEVAMEYAFILSLCGITH